MLFLYQPVLHCKLHLSVSLSVSVPIPNHPLALLLSIINRQTPSSHLSPKVQLQHHYGMFVLDSQKNKKEQKSLKSGAPGCFIFSLRPAVALLSCSILRSPHTITHTLIQCSFTHTVIQSHAHRNTQALFLAHSFSCKPCSFLVVVRLDMQEGKWGQGREKVPSS